MNMFEKLKTLIRNIKTSTSELESDIIDINDFPSVISIVYNVIEPNQIIVTLDNHLPVNYELIVRDINTGNTQSGTYDWVNNVCTITTDVPVVTPFLVVFNVQEPIIMEEL
jgi:hypothetical protein